VLGSAGSKLLRVGTIRAILHTDAYLADAARERTKLRAEVGRLRAVLREIAESSPDGQTRAFAREAAR
jgi:hypothetical protein